MVKHCYGPISTKYRRKRKLKQSSGMMGAKQLTYLCRVASVMAIRYGCGNNSPFPLLLLLPHPLSPLVLFLWTLEGMLF